MNRLPFDTILQALRDCGGNCLATHRALAAEYGAAAPSPTVLYRAAEKAGIARARGHMKAATRRALLARMRRGTEGNAVLARLFGVSRQSVAGLRRRAGIPCPCVYDRTRGEAALVMRLATGLPWWRIAGDLGYTADTSAVSGARTAARRRGIAWPLTLPSTSRLAA